MEWSLRIEDKFSKFQISLLSCVAWLLVRLVLTPDVESVLRFRDLCQLSW